MPPLVRWHSPPLPTLGCMPTCVQVTRTALQPVLEYVGPPAVVAVQALQAAGGQAWSALAGDCCAALCCNSALAFWGSAAVYAKCASTLQSSTDLCPPCTSCSCLQHWGSRCPQSSRLGSRQWLWWRWSGGQRWEPRWCRCCRPSRAPLRRGRCCGWATAGATWERRQVTSCPASA